MQLVLWLLAFSLSALLAIPTVIYAVECIAGSLPVRPKLRKADTLRPLVAILVPAHDEMSGIDATLKSILNQMREGDRLLVVADNCTDNTAAIARAAGAEVLERSDSVNRGKGYAVDFGLVYLALSPPPVVVFVDADCTLVDGTLDELARLVSTTGRPVQSCYLMSTPAGQKGNLGIAEFAFRVKNLVRPRGLSRFGLPCLLTGTGMALPWALVGKVQFAHHHLVEDMKLGLDLAAAGHAPVCCETAGVRSFFPETVSGTFSQRSRWESGHLSMVMACLPRLFTRRTLGNRDCLVMTLDILVPPLTLLAYAQAFAIAAGLLVALFEFGRGPLTIGIASAFLLATSTAIAWAAHGRDVVPVEAVLKIPGYMVGKARIYYRLVSGRMEQVWVRTDRTRV
ncbi:glycosyltransferase family 2 protein [Mesorhizobium sp. AR10]|uniref:glycosyltransferase family 2 protein n=1 Tax=Mesorhizobium sp. AR10 TaxID=2865839 RepID=UPI0021610943|nr:glycosyltransferase family 2 protein [Mesorhizobium sp. AR10]UVK40217.1 glycosyltransferase family 2 protein [Mesorhizobium sp. AR10]